MKIKLHLKLLILGALISSGLFSQKVDYERDTKWNIGFNMGAVFQDSDIKLKTPGFGYGFTFGRSIYERPNGFFGVDLRFRYLRGTTYGMDPNRLSLDTNDTFYNEPEHNYVDSVGYTYLNNSTDLHDYSLEMVINFHRLRERTGILFHIFGGIGITDYQTKTDLLNKDGFLYDYSGLDTSGTSVSQAQKDLLDGDYESDANTHDSRQIKVMPSLGFGLGYQITPSFSIGVEHRTTFTLNDVFEGHAAAGSEFVNLKSGNDLYHYTGVNLRWNIFKGKYKEPTTTNQTQTDAVTPYNPCDKPTVRIINPSANEKFESQYISVSAKVSRIKTNNDVIVKVNSKSVQTQYSASTELVTANLTLVNGDNTIEVIATNSCGKTVKTIKVNYQDKKCLKPVIQISAPAKVVNQATQTLAAKVIHLNGGTLSVLLNGTKVVHAYNSSTQDLSASLNLVKGSNTILVKGTNACGDTTVSLNVVLNEVPCLKPTAFILAPSNGTKSQYQAITVSARINNQTDRNFISVKLNGNSVPFTFSPSSQLASASLSLLEGNNIVQVKVTNECGVDTKTITVIYEKAPCLAPILAVVSPQNGQTYNQSSVSFNATVQNVTSGNQLKLKLNGTIVASNFNAFNKSVTANLNLTKGSNMISITATNDCGSVTKEITVVYSCEKPTVNVISPANGLVVTTGNVQLSGSAINLVNQNQLSVKLNGRAVAFSFNNQTSAFSGILNLINGVNIVNVTATNECGTATKEIRVTYNEPCLKPVVTITAPVANQNFTLANINLTGFIANVTNQSQVTIKKDGVPVNFTLNGGNISANLVLAKGNNTITVTATNSCGTVTVSIPVTYDAPCPKPTVTIVSPQNGQVFNTSAISFVANVSNITNSSQAIVSLNGTIVAGAYNGSNKTITSTLNLIAGNNTIKVVAQNSCGSDVKSITVTYTKPCDKPVVSISSPTNGQAFTSALATLSGSVLNINYQAELILKLNGVIVANTYNASNKTYSANLTLQEGSNTIEVKATNKCGSDTKSITVAYTKPCDKPVVSIFSPTNGQAFTTASVTLSGSVLNINNQAELTLKLNGVTVANTYNASNKTYSANLTLQEGSNTIEVKATNKCGSDTKSITVTYTKPCDNPDVRINTPSDGKVVKKAPIQLTGLVYNVTAKNQVEVLLNGVSQNFNFNASSKTYNASLILKEGVNTIEVKATTSCGVSSKKVTVNYEDCKIPTVTISSPTNNKIVTQTQVSYSATVVNATAKSEIAVMANGASATFSYNATTGVVSGVANVVDGSNIIKVTVTKECGTATAEVTLTKEKCDKPVITIGNDLDGTTVTDPNLTLDGYAQNIGSAAQMTIKVNGTGKTYNYNTKSNIYSLGLVLVSGTNTIVLTATNNCGTTTKTITIIYNPCYKPTLALIKPQDRVTIYTKTQVLSATVSNVTNKNQVTLVLNGKNFPFTLSGNTITANLTGLVVGGNNIMIKVVTPCGSAAKEAFVTVREIKPVITIKTPVKDNTINTNEKSIRIEGSVDGIFKSSSVSIVINGKKVKPTSIKPVGASNYQFISDLTLVDGKNTIVVKATNKYSFTDVKTIIVNSTQPKTQGTRTIEPTAPISPKPVKKGVGVRK